MRHSSLDVGFQSLFGGHCDGSARALALRLSTRRLTTRARDRAEYMWRYLPHPPTSYLYAPRPCCRLCHSSNTGNILQYLLLVLYHKRGGGKGTEPADDPCSLSREETPSRTIKQPGRPLDIRQAPNIINVTMSMVPSAAPPPTISLDSQATSLPR